MIEQVLAWQNLCDAWERVADNRGAPGPDRVSISRFARHWEENLRRLAQLIREEHYRPGRLRRVVIPKRRGGQRLLRIANVGDRVIQRAVLNILDDHYEQRFLPCSYGYRPRRSLRNAVAEIVRLRERGLRWVLDADIDECFDSLDHDLLDSFLAADIDDQKVLHLLRMWIAAGRRYRNPDRGIAQGMPVAPLLCNLYLHRMDQQLLRWRWSVVRYADDLVVCCSSQNQAKQAHVVVAQVLADLKLTLEPRKTLITSFDDGFVYLGVHFKENSYSFTWEDKRFTVEGPTPGWVWGYIPTGYT